MTPHPQGWTKWIWLLALWAWPEVGFADHQPGVNIEILTEQIAQTPNYAELYYQRADEYIYLNKMAEAEADLKKALELKPDYLPAHRLCSKIAFSRGESDAALKILRDATANVPEAYQFLLPGCKQLEGEILLEQNKNTEALAAFDASLKISGIYDLDLMRLRSEAQRRLGKTEERIADLKLAWDKTSAIILRNEWLDALIDAGKITEALPYVQNEMQISRFRSSWLIRRAMIFQAAQKTAEATADLEEAIAEIDARIAPLTAAPWILLADRGLALALLGKTDAAITDIKKARELGGASTNLLRAERILKLAPAEKEEVGAPNKKEDPGAAPPQQ